MAKVKVQKVHSLTGRINPQLVQQAWLAVRRNRGAAGVDRVSVEMFEANLEQNLDRLMRELKSGAYQPLPARRVYIPKAPGKFRPLGIPAVRDRIAQEVLRRLLNPIFDNRFHDDSYGFRPGRSAHQAVERVLELYQQGYRVVLDADIKGFFDNLSHQAVMREVSAVVADGNILRLIEKFLRAGVLEGGDVLPTRVGTPQGGVISPLLANIALNVLDQYLENRGCRFVRYADDFIVLCRARTEAEEVLSDIRPVLAGMGLELSPEKTVVRSFQEGFDFLGFRITRWSVKMRPKKVEAFKEKIRSLTRRSHNLDATVIGKLNAAIRGTANYFAREWSACGDAYRSLDRWIRMRLRCMKFKRKHKTDNWRLRLKHLRNMGLLSLTELIPKASGRPYRFPLGGNSRGVARCGKAARR